MNRTAIAPLALALALAFVAGCSSTPTAVEQPKGTSAGYRSARFVVANPNPGAGQPEDSPVVLQSLRDTVRSEFVSHGLVFGSDDADLIVAYMLLRQDAGSTAMNSDHFGYGRDAVAILDQAHRVGVVESTSFDQIETGAIVIDILDAKSNTLVYRDFSKGRIDRSRSAPEQRAAVAAGVREALAAFFQ